MGGISSVAVVIFGVIWTIIAFSITSNMPEFVIIAVIFPLFGIVFIALGIAQAVYQFKNATSENRFSTFDITTDEEEFDPLNKKFGKKSESTNFCPYCGSKTESDHQFCKQCGKKIT